MKLILNQNSQFYVAVTCFSLCLKKRISSSSFVCPLVKQSAICCCCPLMTPLGIRLELLLAGLIGTINKNLVLGTGLNCVFSEEAGISCKTVTSHFLQLIFQLVLLLLQSFCRSN
ncbi:hypothetical protein CHARACLAT_023092 [Characodon lateralis]|uniref:Uncharacterized protein n=1 Tax=Characodon lateralis TaxID=208331 RepID=A0ABU7F5Q9_9TELE|nr:hypothetical protein [Characodon lateralis]